MTISAPTKYLLKLNLNLMYFLIFPTVINYTIST